MTKYHKDIKEKLAKDMESKTSFYEIDKPMQRKSSLRMEHLSVGRLSLRKAK